MTAPAADHGTEAASFRKEIGLFDATMLVAGSMIGSGIFIVSADIARDVGSAGWLLLIWFITGVMTVIGALSYAELAAMMPDAGGQYVFLREAYAPLWGFLYGWTAFLVIQTGFIAAVSVAFAKYLGVLVPELGTDQVLWQVQDLGIHLRLAVPWLEQPLTFFKRDVFAISAGQLVAVVIVVLLTIVNCLGVQYGKWVQNVFTLAKITGLIGLIVLGWTIARNPAALAANFENLWQGIWTTPRFEETRRIVPDAGLAAFLVLCGAMVGALFSADAWNNITFVAAEIHEPRRNLPLSLLLGTSLVIFLYLLANTAYLAALPLHGDPAGSDAYARGIDHAHNDRVGTAVLEQASPALGVPFMAVVIMISTFGCTNGLILMGARLYYAMAQDNLFFKNVGRLTGGIPRAGLILQGLWSVLLIFSGSYSELLDYIVFAALMFYVLTVIALFRLRVRKPDVPRPYRAVGYPVVPILYIAACSVIMLALLIVRPVYSWPSFVIVLAGFPVYFYWRRGAR